MRVIAFDGRMGASGDMILGALIDAGADPDVLSPVEAALDVEYTLDTTTKCGVTATDVDVLLTDSDLTREPGGHGHNEGHSHDHGHDEGHSHDHGHGHTHEHNHRDEEGTGNGHSHGDEHGHCRGDNHDHAETHGSDQDGTDATEAQVHAEGHGPHRSYPAVVEIVEGMGLDASIERDALAIFELLATAEASVHGTDLESTHFHEVGADDAIADVVGAVSLLADLDPDRVVTTPLAMGGGTASMSHGTYPVPGPAVVEIAQQADWSVSGGPIDRELLTPTGAAILARMADGVDSVPRMQLDSSGYGAGTADFSEHPNVLRALVGTLEETNDTKAETGELVSEEITVLETNLDDTTPEILGGLHTSLADAGARDVSILPATMKKSRPGHLIKVICKPEDSQQIARQLAEETGTLGIRETGVSHRWIAHRSFETVSLDIDGETYDVTVKVATDDDGTIYDVSTEYDDASAVASETGLPVRTIVRRAEAEFSTNSS